MTMYNYSNRVCTVDTYEEEKNESKTIDITIGVFFDGTGNKNIMCTSTKEQRNSSKRVMKRI